MYHLAMLHIIAQEWDKVGGFCESLQTKYAEANGEALAAELQQIANRYRTKLERRQRDGP